MATQRLFTREALVAQPGRPISHEGTYGIDRITNSHMISPIGSASCRTYSVANETAVTTPTELGDRSPSPEPDDREDIMDFFYKRDTSNEAVLNTISIDEPHPRKRRKPIIPPQKYSSKQARADYTIHNSSDEDASKRSSLDDSIQATQQTKESDFDQTKVSYLKESELINRMSRQAVIAFRRTLSQLKLKQDVKSEADDDDDDARIEKVIGETLLNLEPQIVQLVDQTLKLNVLKSKINLTDLIKPMSRGINEMISFVEPLSTESVPSGPINLAQSPFSIERLTLASSRQHSPLRHEHHSPVSRSFQIPELPKDLDNEISHEFPYEPRQPRSTGSFEVQQEEDHNGDEVEESRGREKIEINEKSKPINKRNISTCQSSTTYSPYAHRLSSSTRPVGMNNPSILTNRIEDADQLLTKFAVTTMHPAWNLSTSVAQTTPRSTYPPPPPPPNFPLGLFPHLHGLPFTLPFTPTLDQPYRSSLQARKMPWLTFPTEGEEQTEALALIVRKKNSTKSDESDLNDGHTAFDNHGFQPNSRRRRTKVTDTRVNARTALTNGQPEFLPPKLLAADTEVSQISYNSLIDQKTAFSQVEHTESPQGRLSTPTDVNPRSTSRNVGTSESVNALLSPCLSTEINRINSSCSSPSPSSARLSNGIQDPSTDNGYPFGGLSSEKLASFSMALQNSGFSSTATLLPSNPSACRSITSPFGLNCRKIDSWTAKRDKLCQSLSKPYDPFEQMLSKSLRQSYPSVRQQHQCQPLRGLLDPMPGPPGSFKLNSSNVTSNILSDSHGPFNSLFLPTSRFSIGNEQALADEGQSEMLSLERPGFCGQSIYRREQGLDSLRKRDIVRSMAQCPTYSDGDNLSGKERSLLQACADGINLTTTLTPVHLRKAKLMFFFVRYPNSTLIKMYFPDVKFYKNNTAQLVKWFSNFREFYYIQMEKYARIAISEGIRKAEDIHMTTDSELYRALNLHYNRNQQLEVPEHFRFVVEATLKEFFNAIFTGKDVEQSWKKPIYKIIARMDQTVPDFFKSHNWMNQLADG